MSTYPAIAAGQRITGSLLTSMLPNVVLKQADEPLVSTTALQNDDELFAAVAANATYILDGHLAYSGEIFTAPGPADLKVDWTVPTGAVMRWSRVAYPSNAANSVDSVETDNSTIRVLGTYGSTTTVTAGVRGRIITGSTAGTLQLRWAQNASNATATTMKAGSWIRLVRIA